MNDLAMGYSLLKKEQELQRREQEVELKSMEVNKRQEECNSRLVSAQNEVEECNRELIAKSAELALVQKERNEELALKEKELKSVEVSIAERMKELKAMENQLNQPGNRLATCQVNSSTTDCQSCISENGKHLQSLLNESYRKQDSVHKEAFIAIQKSADPGKLVLDAMQDFYPADIKERDSEFDLSVIRRSCLTLLEKLLKFSPDIKPEIREEAMELALEWKSRMKTPCENDLEVPAFLQLVTAFKLTSSFSQDELQSSLDVIYQNRQVVLLRRALGFAECLPANQRDSSLVIDASDYRLIKERVHPLILGDEMDSPDLMPHEIISALSYSPDPAKLVLEVVLGSYSQHIENGGAELDVTVVKNVILLMEQLMERKPEISPGVKEGSLKLLALWKENVTRETVKGLEVCAFLLFLNTYGLSCYFNTEEVLGLLVKVAQLKHAPGFCQYLGFADKIPELILILLQRKQYNEAVRFICSFGLLHVFPIDTIQNNFVEDIWKSAKDQAMGNELSTRKDILQCILDYKLDLVYDTSAITSRISELEAQKASNMTLPSVPDRKPAKNHKPTNGPKPTMIYVRKRKRGSHCRQWRS